MRRMWRGLVGEVTAAQSCLVLGAAAVSAIAVARRTAAAGPATALVMGAVALDVVGGLVAFQLPATRERYATRSRRSRLAFAALHVQPVILPVVGQGSPRRAVARYAGAVAATALIDVVPRDAARRPLTAQLLAAALSAADLATSAGDPQRWFGPVYLMKVVGGRAGIPRP